MSNTILKRNTISFESNLNGTPVWFKGNVFSDIVLGTYTWPDRVNKNVSLMRCCADSEINIDYNTLADWIDMLKLSK